MMSLAGKTALVTAGSCGIGRAIALRFAEAGAQVLIHCSTSCAEASDVVASIVGAGGRAAAVAADLGAPGGPHKLAAAVRNVVGDRLDVLVSNAGVSTASGIDEMTVGDFDRTFAVNVRGPFFLLQQLLPILCKGSSVIFTLSPSATLAAGDIAACASTTGAVETLVKYFAVSLGGKGVRVNAVAPGMVDTNVSTHAGRPEDIAGAALFLASSEAAWVTGACIAVDGGAAL